MHQGNPDQGCAIATTLPPHHSSYARHPPPVAQIPPHPMAPHPISKTQILTNPEVPNSQELLHRSIH